MRGKIHIPNLQLPFMKLHPPIIVHASPPHSPTLNSTGVRCVDMVDGYRCGPCPLGQTGDGRTCTYVNACDPNPCYPGVQCGNINSEPFFRCGPCPPGLTGNGEKCDDIDEVRKHHLGF